MTSLRRGEPSLQNCLHQVRKVRLIAAALQTLLCSLDAFFFEEHGFLLPASGTTFYGSDKGGFFRVFRKENADGDSQ
jgi:hypothetical protein